MNPAGLAPQEPTHADLRLLPDAALLVCGARQLRLPRAELQMLLRLMQAGGRPVQRSALTAAGWGPQQTVTAGAFDVALHRLRRRLAASGSRVQIVTLAGAGYALSL